MLKLIASIVFFAMLATVAFADEATPQTVPGTDISRPAHDVECDAHFDAGEYREALADCRASLDGYRAIVAQAVREGLDDIADQLRYDQAFTDFEIASSRKHLGADALGEMDAKEAYGLYVAVHDKYWRLVNAAAHRSPDDHTKIDTAQYTADQVAAMTAALTDEQAKLAAEFVKLMMRVHAFYPAVYADEAKIQAPESGDDKK